MATSVPRFCLGRDRFSAPLPLRLAPLALAVLLVAAGCASGASESLVITPGPSSADAGSEPVSDDAASGSSGADTTTTGQTLSDPGARQPSDEPPSTPDTGPTTTAADAGDSDGDGDSQEGAKTDDGLIESPAPTTAPTTTVAGVTASTVPTTTAVHEWPPLTTPRPDWLGQRVLPTSPNGRVVTPQTTPEALRDRRLATKDTLARPPDPVFRSTSEPLSPEVLARSTWKDGCPVPPEDLRYLTMTFIGFDGEPHTGEMIVHRDQAANIIAVFSKLFEARYPIEEMRIVTTADLDAPPTGDGNNTTAFVCRAVTGGTSFSQHAYGLAIDINPFHNPYLRGEFLLPELADAYLERLEARPGVIQADDHVVQAFAEVGWSWGGYWRSLKDYQHFSLNNR